MKESNQERNSEKDTPLGTQSNSNARRQSNDRVEQNQSTSSRPRKRNFNWLKHPDETNLTTWQTDFLKHDWDHSALGSIHSWKPWLTQLVLMAMADPTPTLIFIDDDQGNAHAVVYNEAICPLIGDKHPSLQGSDPKIGYSEIWERMNGIFDQGREKFEYVLGTCESVLLHRHGFLEDTWWDWLFMPVLDSDGHVGANYVTCADKTAEYIARRRALVLEALDARMLSVSNSTQVWKAVEEVLQEAVSDIPSALLYSAKADNSDQLQLECCLGFPAENDVPNILHPSMDCSIAKAIYAAIEAGKSSIVQAESFPLDSRTLFKTRQHDEVCREVIICPLKVSFGVLVIALDPRSRYTPAGRTFFLDLVKELNAVFTRYSLDSQLLVKKKEVEESDRKFSALASRAPVGVALFALDGRLEYANEYWYNVFQWHPTPGEDPKAWIHRVDPEDQEETMRTWQAITAGDEKVSLQFRVLTPRKAMNADGGEGPITVYCRAYLDHAADGTVQNVMSCLVDISDIKDLESRLRARTEEVEVKMAHLIEVKKQQENFIDMTSHEIRNPLSAVLHLADDIYQTSKDLLSYTELSHEHIEKETLQSALTSTCASAETILSCVLHQKRIVDDILVVSRLESGVLVVTPVPTQPSHLIQTALKMFEAEVRTSNTTLTFIEDDSLEVLSIDHLLFDSSRVLQILVNLVGNAIKFTKLEETRQIKVIMAAALTRPSEKTADIEYIPISEIPQVQAFDEDGEVVWLSLSVIDSGRGLSSSEKQRLFKRFSQATKKTHTQYGGSGLGLFIAKQLTEIHGGQIGFVSEKHQGSNFTFFIQTVRCEAPSKTSSQIITPASAQTPLLKQAVIPNGPSSLDIPKISSIFPFHLAATILIVEDNIVNQRILSQLLTKKGCVVHVANHGLEALEFLRRTTFFTGAAHDTAKVRLSIILLDLEMPIMDGMTTVKKIREMERGGELNAHVPVLAVTANARAEQLDEMIEAGMDSSITKPYQIPEMMKMITRLAFRHQEP